MFITIHKSKTKTNIKNDENFFSYFTSEKISCVLGKKLLLIAVTKIYYEEL